MPRNSNNGLQALISTETHMKNLMKISWICRRCYHSAANLPCCRRQVAAADLPCCHYQIFCMRQLWV